MKLLIITQKVDQNEQLLGFFIGWIVGLASRFDKITVGCLEKGEFDLPDDIRVVSFGKERGISKIGQLFNFYKLIIGESRNYDAVLVHMNPIWVVLGGWWWRISGKKISLWYAHGTVSSTLQLAEKFAHIIFTSTKEGCRIKSSKIKIVGQGIDVEKFKIQFSPQAQVEGNSKLKIVSVGRISPSKDYGTLIDAINILCDENMVIEIIGGPGIPEDAVYREKLKQKIKTNGLGNKFIFRGAVSNSQIVSFLQSADLFINMGQTGSLDKAVLEAMAVGLPVVTCNEAYEDVLGELKTRLMYSKKDAAGLSERILYILNMDAEEKSHLSARLRQIVVENHNLNGLLEKISQILKNNG